VSVRILIGDVRDRLRGMEADSVNCVVTSPPYWGLRSYQENAVKIDPALSSETRAWLVAELEKRSIRAGL
jgi:DNA modification methylase